LKKDEKNYPIARNLGIAITIPMVFIAGPIIGFFAGNWIDHKWHTAPWGMITLILLGFVASVKQVINFIKQATDSNNSEKDKK